MLSFRKFSSSIHRLESSKNDDETTIIQDPAAATADDQDIETIDETKIDDLDKRLTLVSRKYTLIKRRVIDKHSRTRLLRKNVWVSNMIDQVGDYHQYFPSNHVCWLSIHHSVQF